MCGLRTLPPSVPPGGRGVFAQVGDESEEVVGRQAADGAGGVDAEQDRGVGGERVAGVLPALGGSEPRAEGSRREW